MKTARLYEIGCVRKNNEDAFLISEPFRLFAVADGMGGHKSGEIASSLAIEVLQEKAPELASLETEQLQHWMQETIEEANRTIFAASQKTSDQEGMGTTLTALAIKENKAVVGHVGDSRIYLWREDQLTLLSEDHSMVNELIRLGQLTEDSAKHHPHKNVLSRALGVDIQTVVDCIQLEVQPEDVYLLCTDGFTNMLDEEEIARTFRLLLPWEERLGKLKAQVIERGATDNFTVVCCILSGEDNDQ